MFSRTMTTRSISSYCDSLVRLGRELDKADAVLIGAGAGLSVSAGFTYSGKRFEEHFSDFQERYGFHDMYSGGFYPYDTLEEYWAFWSRNIDLNRYQPAPTDVYGRLLELVREKDYFVLTTNVDHQFQKAGFERKRLFYTQGDYGLWQCSRPCHQKTYDNEAAVRQMLSEQRDMKIPTELIPRCHVCGDPMTMNMRVDNTFVQDEDWYAAAKRSEDFLLLHEGARVLFFGIGSRGKYAGHHQVPFLADDGEKSESGVWLCQFGRSVLPKRDRKTVCLHQR